MNTTLNSSTIIPFPKNGAASPDHAVAAPYQWFRLYNDVIYDPKVQRLNGETFKAWINILCLASKNGGLLPCVADLAYALRMTDQAAADLIQTLRRLNLLDVVADATYTPHNWNGRQFKSDTSADRMRRHRDRKRHGDVTVTRPEQTQTQTQIRTDSDSDSETDKGSANRTNGSKAASNTAKADNGFDLNGGGGGDDDKAEKNRSEADKNRTEARLFAELRGYGQLHGHLQGWAAKRFKARCGRLPEPAWMAQPAVDPSPATVDWIEADKASYLAGKDGSGIESARPDVRQHKYLDDLIAKNRAETKSPPSPTIEDWQANPPSDDTEVPF